MKTIAFCMLVAVASGCGSSDDSSDVKGPKRTMVTGSLYVGSAVNLVPDPGFALIDAPKSYGGFYGYGGADSGPLTVQTMRDSRSPAGLRGAVALLTSPGATDNAGSAMAFIGAVTGGAGPFHAEVWLSRSSLALDPIAIDGNLVSVAMLDQQGGAANLEPVPAAALVVAGRTWTPYRVDFPNGFDQGGYLTFTFAASGGTWHIAAPTLTAQPLVDGLATRSLRSSVVRAQTAAEQTAVAKLRARPHL